MAQTIIFSWLFGSHDNVAHLFLHCSDLIHIRNSMWKPQVRYLTCADPENFLEGGGGGVTFRQGWVQLHTSGFVINL